MSIATEITRLQNAKASIKTSIENKGVTVPYATKLDGYSTLIDSIQTGGGGISIDDLAQNLQPSGAITLSDSVTKIGDYAFIKKPITSVVGNNVTTIGTESFHFCPLTSISFPNLTSITGGSTFRNTNLVTVNLPKLASMSSSYVFSDNTLLEIGVFPSFTASNQSFRGSKFLTLDFGKKISIGNYWFTDCGRLTTLILRSTELCPCTNTGGFNGTPFKNGGTGGTIYIPKSLYDHLGDGTANDYKNATNWSTLDGYGTVTWAKIEGTQYENYYADGTPIGA